MGWLTINESVDPERLTVVEFCRASGRRSRVGVETTIVGWNWAQWTRTLICFARALVQPYNSE
jgi:hypothetical protein